MHTSIKFKQGLLSTTSNQVFKFVNLDKNEVVMNSAQSIFAIISRFSDNYLIEVATEDELVWDISGGNWLYVDVDTTNGTISAGTSVNKFQYGATYPQNPTIDDHFFDTDDCAGYKWTGSKWVLCDRIYVCSIKSGRIRQMYIGSHVGISGKRWPYYKLGTTNVGASTGHYNKPNLRNDYRGADTLTKNLLKLNLRVASRGNMRAFEDIDPLTCVTVTEDGVSKCLGGNFDCVGVALNSTPMGESVQLATNQHIHTPNIFWGDDPNTLLFIADDGSLTTSPPTDVSTQNVGYVVSKNLIHINIHKKVKLL